MAYGTTISPERLYREKILAMQAMATDFTSATAAGSSTAQTVTVNDTAGKITTAVAGTQASDATLTVTVTCAGITTADVAFCTMSLVSGTAAGYSVLSAVCTTNTITIVIINSGATAWASTPVFLVNYLVVKSLAASVAN